MKKSALGAGLIEQKVEIYYLEIKLHEGNKRSTCEITSKINAHEEMGSIDSGFPKNARRKAADIR